MLLTFQQQTFFQTELPPDDVAEISFHDNIQVNTNTIIDHYRSFLMKGKRETQQQNDHHTCVVVTYSFFLVYFIASQMIRAQHGAQHSDRALKQVHVRVPVKRQCSSHVVTCLEVLCDEDGRRCLM